MPLGREATVVAWSALLAVVVGLPWFAPGFVLVSDMVWVPDLDPTRPDLWGWGSALPRAVPSDGVVALLGAVLPAALVQRVVLLGALTLAGIGGARLLADLPVGPRLIAATVALWNPFVAERLALGQWPLLVGYAGLLWLGAELLSAAPRWWVVVLALVATAMSPATGVMAILMSVLVMLLTITVAGRRAVPLVVLAAIGVNLPWILAGLVNDAALDPDPAAIGLFEAQPEGVLGRWGAVLSLGGVWNTDAVPVSRTLDVSAVTLTLLALIALAGVVALLRQDRRRLLALGLLAATGVSVAALGWLAPDLLVAGIERFGAPVALFRDGTRYLALLAPLLVVAVAQGAHAVGARIADPRWRSAPVVLALVLPLAALPDLAAGLAGRLQPVDYPASWSATRQIVEDSSVPGDLLILPFTAYRAPAWNDGRAVLDPAGRYFPRVTVTNDDLVVSGRSIEGEDPRAARIEAILEVGEDVGPRLAAEGIGLVLLDPTAGDAPLARRQVAGLREIAVPGGDLRLFAVPDASEPVVSAADRRVVLAGWTVLALLLAAGTARGLVEVIAGTRGPRSRAARFRPAAGGRSSGAGDADPT